MKREAIREKTMQLIFQMDVTGDFDFEKALPIEETANAIEKAQAVATLTAVRDHFDEITETINSNLDNWKPDRIAKVDLAILRNAVAEMLYVEDLPTSISINEAVNLAKKFGDDKSYAFVNSVLSKVAKGMEK